MKPSPSHKGREQKVITWGLTCARQGIPMRLAQPNLQHLNAPSKSGIYHCVSPASTAGRLAPRLGPTPSRGGRPAGLRPEGGVVYPRHSSAG